MKILWLMLFFLLGCAGSPDRAYEREDAYILAAESFARFEHECHRKGMKIVFPNKQSTRIRRGDSLEDMRSARCQS